MLSTVTATELAAGDLVTKRLHGAAEREPVDPGRRRGDRPAGVRQSAAAPTSARWRTAPPPRATPASRCSTRSRPRRLNEPGAAFSTPGSIFTGAFNTANPVAWGFDDGGFIYRDATGNPIYDPSTMNGNGRRSRGAAAVSYANPLKSLGFSRSATGAGKLDGRPHVVDQPFGAGHAIMFGHNPFYRVLEGGRRAHRAQRPAVPDDRGPAAGGDAGRGREGRAGRRRAAAQERAARGRLAAGAQERRRPRRADPGRAQAHGQAQAAPCGQAKLPKTTRKQVRYVRSGRTVTLVVKGARRSTNDHGAASGCAGSSAASTSAA